MTNVIPSDIWLDLADAARYLGVHFTTLRRWADAGDVPCIRTPGGRRRFALADLRQFLADARQLPAPDSRAVQTTTLGLARQHIEAQDMRQQPWFVRLSDGQRQQFRQSGQRLMALLMQFGMRSGNGGAFLDEGKRTSAEYGAAFCQAGLSLTETTRVFLLFRRSILDSVFETAGLTGAYDCEGQRLYQRMSDFLDAMLLATIDGYGAAPALKQP
jgi:excisionase family DNA binding protein